MVLWCSRHGLVGHDSRDCADPSFLDTARLQVPMARRRQGSVYRVDWHQVHQWNRSITVDHHHLPGVLLEITQHKQQYLVHTLWTLSVRSRKGLISVTEVQRQLVFCLGFQGSSNTSSHSMHVYGVPSWNTAKHSNNAWPPRQPRNVRPSVVLSTDLTGHQLDPYSGCRQAQPPHCYQARIQEMHGSARPRPCSLCYRNQSWRCRLRSKMHIRDGYQWHEGYPLAAQKATSVLWGAGIARQSAPFDVEKAVKVAGYIPDVPGARGCFAVSPITSRSTTRRGVSRCSFLSQRKTL